MFKHIYNILDWQYVRIKLFLSFMEEVIPLILLLAVNKLEKKA